MLGSTTMPVEPDKEEPDERGQNITIDDAIAQLIVANYRNINHLKAALAALPYFQSKELFAGSEALTRIMNRAVEDLPPAAVLQALCSGVTLTQHLLQLNSAFPFNATITDCLLAILYGFQQLHSHLSKKTV